MQLFEYKLVVVVPSELDLSKGKLAVQVAHAAVSCAAQCKKTKPQWLGFWLKEGQKKVVLKVKTVNELYELERLAKTKNIPVRLVTDAGLTEIPKGTVTCLGLGPGPNDLIDELTGKLPLL